MKFTAETQRTQRFEGEGFKNSFQTLRSLRLCGADFYSAIKGDLGGGRVAEIQVENREEVIEKVKKMLDKLISNGIVITSAYLYGSYAFGNPRPDSDIDVAVISDDLSGYRLDDWCRLNGLATRVDARMEVIGFRPERFRDEHPLAWEIKNSGIRLV
jgi:predicted nucleotidyltransferase